MCDKPMLFILFVIHFFLYFLPMSATECLPWLGNYYEFEFRSNLRYQTYAWVDTGSRHDKYLSNDIFLNLSLTNALPDPAIGAEFEVVGAKTRKQGRGSSRALSGDVDQLKLTGRYLWLDDVAGDSFSLVSGLSYIQAFKSSLRDVSSFHHGLYNGECFISFGRESPGQSFRSLWGSRWWGLFALGIAEQGSPWLRFDLAYDNRFGENHEINLFLHSLWGFGGKRLHIHHFHGYGPIKHQSIDVGMRYTYELEYFGNATLEYSYRVYANQFPAYVHQVVAQLLYTFGL